MKHWTRQESKERFPKAITPLGWSLLQVPLEASLHRMSETLGVKKYSRNEMILWKDFYIYTRKDFFSDFKNLKPDFLRLIKLLFSMIATFFETLFKTSSEKASFKVKFINRLFWRVLGDDVEGLIKRWPVQVEHLKTIMGRDYKLQDVETLDYEKFLQVKTQMQEDSKLFFAEDFNVYFLKNIIFGLLKSQLVSSGVTLKEAESLLVSLSNNLEGNFSIAMIEDFNNQNLSTQDLKQRYGHLTDNWDLYNPTFGEQTLLWEQRQLIKEVSLRSNTQAMEVILKRLSWNTKAQELIECFQKMVLMDEDLRAYSSLQYPQARTLMKMVEQTPAWKELIIPDDSIYFLHLNEIEFGLKKSDFHLYFDLMKQRRIDFNQAIVTKPPFEFNETMTGTFQEITMTEGKTQALAGECVFGGRVEGIVTHISEYADLSKITKSSIIVLESATPVFAPFYTMSGGIISEMGGQLSHGAIVAREYGIPMLTGVKSACTLLKEGQKILLDADSGEIKVIN